MFYESAGLAFRIFIDFHKYFLPYPKIMKGTSLNYYSNTDIPLRFCTDRTESFCQALLHDSPLFLRTKNDMCFRFMEFQNRDDRWDFLFLICYCSVVALLPFKVKHKTL